MVAYTVHVLKANFIGDIYSVIGINLSLSLHTLQALILSCFISHKEQTRLVHSFTFVLSPFTIFLVLQNLRLRVMVDGGELNSTPTWSIFIGTRASERARTCLVARRPWPFPTPGMQTPVPYAEECAVTPSVTDYLQSLS